MSILSWQVPFQRGQRQSHKSKHTKFVKIPTPCSLLFLATADLTVEAGMDMIPGFRQFRAFEAWGEEQTNDLQ